MNDVVLKFGQIEIDILRSLVSQLAELLSVEQEPDGFEAPNLDVADPVVQRLFPKAYLDDPVAEGDFRRYTMDDQRLVKLESAARVATGIEANVRGRISLAPNHLDDWLRTLTALRLSLGVRLGVDDPQSPDLPEDLAEDDPRQGLFQIYEWLAEVLEFLVEADLAQDDFDNSQR